MIIVTASLFTLIGFIAGILVAGRSRAEVETRIIELEQKLTGAKIQHQALVDIYKNLVQRHQFFIRHYRNYGFTPPNDPNDPNDEK